MDIHRCRFVPYPSSTINVLAFSHAHISRKVTAANAALSSVRLAIGRANGDIEIWNPLNGGWLQETTLKGGKDRSVDGLVWIQEPNEEDSEGNVIIGRLRLFSVGYTTTVTEWDLENRRPLRMASGNHGEIWCLAAQMPFSEKSNGADSEEWKGQHLVTGCTDGAVVLYSTADSDLRLEKILVKPSARKAKIISITFKDRNVVVAGCTDSTIRVWDIRNGSLLRAITLGIGPSGGPKEIIVWAVKCLVNGNIVSGDSTGEIRIWDGKTYTLMQRIKSHVQDVLSLAASRDGMTIFSGGMDRRTVVYKQAETGKARFAEVSHRRYHSHDVKTMATFESKSMSVCVSGGPDVNPIVIPLKEVGLENQRGLSALPQESILQSAPSKRLVMSWWDREVHIWRIAKQTKAAPEAEESDSESEGTAMARKLVAKIMIKGEANITSACINSSGTLLAVATVFDIKLFRLKMKREGEALRVSKLEATSTFSKGAKSVHFSPDGKWLAIVRDNNQILAVRIIEDDSTIIILPKPSKLHRLDRKIHKRTTLGGLGTYDRNINLVTFSSDSRILATSDLAGYIDTWVLEGVEDTESSADDNHGEDASSASSSSNSNSESDAEEDKIPKLILGQHWTRNLSAALIPKLPSAPVILSFRPAKTNDGHAKSNGVVGVHPTRHNPHPQSHDLPSGEDRLLVVTAGSMGTVQVLEFNILGGKLTPWSRRNPTAHFPEEYRGQRDQAKGCLWDVTEARERVWLYGVNWLWMFDLSRDFPVMSSSKVVTTSQNDQRALNSMDTVQSQLSRKRKRHPHEADPEDRELRKNTSGAGSKIPDQILGTGMSRQVQRYVVGEVDEISEIRRKAGDVETGDMSMDVDSTMDDFENFDEEDDAEDNHGALGVSLVRNGEDARKEEEEARTAWQRPPHWWHTYKYRPILGIVALDGPSVDGEGGEEEEAIGPEVVLVERPGWESDLPARYYGKQEWEKGGI